MKKERDGGDDEDDRGPKSDEEKGAAASDVGDDRRNAARHDFDVDNAIAVDRTLDLDVCREVDGETESCPRAMLVMKVA